MFCIQWEMISLPADIISLVVLATHARNTSEGMNKHRHLVSAPLLFDVNKAVLEPTGQVPNWLSPQLI